MLTTRLFDVHGERAVVIDRALLAIIGAEDAEELELTTDGQRLVLQLPRIGAASATRPVVNIGLDDVRFDDPRETLKFIGELREHFGFGQEQFVELHHFRDRASLEAHISYCKKTKRFTSSTNTIVAKRLALCLRLLRQGRKWSEVIARVTSEHPFPTTTR